MILDEKEQCKRAFESEIKDYIKILDIMNRIYDNKVNNIAQCNLLHNIINPSKRTKNINIHYSPILHGYMNTRKGKENFKIFRILLDIGYSSNILMTSLITKLNPSAKWVILPIIQKLKLILPHLNLARQ